jgi:broad specificity phosphatase PhoE
VKPELDEIDAGQHDNLTYEQIAERFPVEFALRDKDKLNYRYPKVRLGFSNRKHSRTVFHLQSSYFLYLLTVPVCMDPA